MKKKIYKGQNKPKSVAKSPKRTKNGNKDKKKSGRVEAHFPHFRYYKRSQHPALIVGEQPIEEYRYRKVTHKEKDGRHLNEKIEPNPNKSDPKPMFIGKRIRHDKKSAFEDFPLPWKPPKKSK